MKKSLRDFFSLRRGAGPRGALAGALRGRRRQPGSRPFGALVRLKPDFVIPDNWTTQAKALATAAKPVRVRQRRRLPCRGDPNPAWDLRTNAQMKTITMADMELVDLKSITSDPRFSRDSMAASW